MGVDYWTLVEPVWETLNRSWDGGPEEFVRLFRSIRPEIGHLYAGHWCQSEVCNGGFHQFFSNTTGLLAPEALEAFQAIGAVDWVRIVAEAIQYFGAPYPRDRDDREKLLPLRQGRSRDDWDPFARLDERFYEWTGDWEETANAYADQIVVRENG